MTLFDNASEANLRACAQMVEDVLAGRKLDPASARLADHDGLAWTFRKGSASISVHLQRDAAGQNTIQVIAPVLRASEEALQSGRLLRRLLELNASGLTQAAFGLRGDDVVITNDRSTAGLDLVEVEEMIRRVSDYADHYDDALVAEFGGKRHSDL